MCHYVADLERCIEKTYKELGIGNERVELVNRKMDEYLQRDSLAILLLTG
jgi:hypothetical protein